MYTTRVGPTCQPWALLNVPDSCPGSLRCSSYNIAEHVKGRQRDSRGTVVGRCGCSAFKHLSGKTWEPPAKHWAKKAEEHSFFRLWPKQAKTWRLFKINGQAFLQNNLKRHRRGNNRSLRLSEAIPRIKTRINTPRLSPKVHHLKGFPVCRYWNKFSKPSSSSPGNLLFWLLTPISSDPSEHQQEKFWALIYWLLKRRTKTKPRLCSSCYGGRRWLLQHLPRWK